MSACLINSQGIHLQNKSAVLIVGKWRMLEHQMVLRPASVILPIQLVNIINNNSILGIDCLVFSLSRSM